MSAHGATVLRGVQIVDGTGAPPLEGDLAIENDRISAVGDVCVGNPAIEIDAQGLAVAPGFIDVHTHDDFAALIHPHMRFKLCGGVTTSVVGNCGFGAAPFAEAMQLARTLHPTLDVEPYQGYAGYFERLDANPTGTNIAVLAGHGTLRMAAMGRVNRAPDDREMAHMRSLLAEALDAGVVGLSSGLIYEPGRYAATDELVALAASMRGTGALYATHMRDEGTGLVESVREAIAIGERGGVPVQISHHKAAGRDSWGLVSQSLALIESAHARGENVHADQYPYTAGSTILRAVLDNGAFLDDPSAGGIGRVRPEDAVIASAPGHPEWEGQSVADLAHRVALPAREAAEHVERAAGGATVVLHMMSEDDVRTVMRHPSTMIGSDGIPTLEGKPHPRLSNTFARVIGHYGRDEGLFSLSEAVYRMTGFCAEKFGLRDRGVLRAGAFADVVVFDPATIIDRGTYQDPMTPPAGIRHVFVNGQQVMHDAELQDARAGRAIRRHLDA